MTAQRNASPILNILVAERFAADISSRIEVPCRLATFKDDGDEAMTAQLQQADVFVSSEFKAAWVSPAMPLRLIQGVGAGTDSIDLAAVPTGCTICNVYGHGQSVAEYVFMVMAMLNREVMIQDAGLRTGLWGSGIMRAGLAGRTLLVLGLGHIGAEVVRWGRFLDMRVRGLTRSPSPARGRELGLTQIGGWDELDHYLPEADFVVVAIPHTVETAGFISSPELVRMKPTAYLVNVARGPVVDEVSLFTALKEKQIAGAAVDVWYRYPAALDECCLPASLPFHELDNIIMTPHNSGYTDRTMAYRFAFIADNIGRLAAGKPLENIVWPQ